MDCDLVHFGKISFSILRILCLKMTYKKSIKCGKFMEQTLFRLQKRILKSSNISSRKTLLRSQKILVKSISVRLLALHNVISVSKKYNFYSSNEIIFNSLFEQSRITIFLKLNFSLYNFTNHQPVVFINRRNFINVLKIFPIVDRVWQCLLKYSLDPVYHSFLFPRSFNFPCSLQKVVFISLLKNSLGNQKRVLLVNLEDTFRSIDIEVLLKRIVVTKSLKFCLFHFLSIFNSLNRYSLEYTFFHFETFFLDIILTHIEDISFSLRFYYHLLIFLRPLDNEKCFLSQVISSVNSVGLAADKVKFCLTSLVNGFDFLGWSFRIRKKIELFCFPSFSSYSDFCTRVFFITQSHLFKSNVKSSKFSLLILTWRRYNFFCTEYFNSKESFLKKEFPLQISGLGSKTFLFSSISFHNYSHIIFLKRDTCTFFCTCCGLSFSV